MGWIVAAGVLAACSAAFGVLVFGYNASLPAPSVQANWDGMIGVVAGFIAALICLVIGLVVIL